MNHYPVKTNRFFESTAKLYKKHNSNKKVGSKILNSVLIKKENTLRQKHYSTEEYMEE